MTKVFHYQKGKGNPVEYDVSTLTASIRTIVLDPVLDSVIDLNNGLMGQDCERGKIVGNPKVLGSCYNGFQNSDYRSNSEKIAAGFGLNYALILDKDRHLVVDVLTGANETYKEKRARIERMFLDPAPIGETPLDRFIPLVRSLAVGPIVVANVTHPNEIYFPTIDLTALDERIKEFDRNPSPEEMQSIVQDCLIYEYAKREDLTAKFTRPTQLPTQWQVSPHIRIVGA